MPRPTSVHESQFERNVQVGEAPALEKDGGSHTLFYAFGDKQEGKAFEENLGP